MFTATDPLVIKKIIVNVEKKKKGKLVPHGKGNVKLELIFYKH